MLSVTNKLTMLIVVMLSVVMLIVVMLSVVMLSVVMLNVIAPLKQLIFKLSKSQFSPESFLF